MSRLILLALLSLSSLAATTTAAASPYRRVDACFVLDTTGSMSGLIAAAKQKIWFIANEIVQAPSHPDVRLCLTGFRDRGDAYVTRRTELTADIDAIYRDLQDYVADGGGDTPEAVNQALLETVDSKAWSTDADTLRLIFLVGDAPPHTDYDEPQYDEIAARAAAKGIIINPVLCGVDNETKTIWDQIARTAHGEAAQIADASEVQRIVTPMDQDLAALNARLGRLIVPYGTPDERNAVQAKQTLSERMDDTGVSDRLAYNSATSRIVQGGGDLVEAIDAGELNVETLDPTRMPDAVRSMTHEELIAHLTTIRSERAQLQRVIGELVAERHTFIADKRKRAGSGFDSVVAATIAKQLAGKK